MKTTLNCFLIYIQNVENSEFIFFIFKICFRLILVTKRVFLVFEKFEYRKQKTFYVINRALIFKKAEKREESGLPYPEGCSNHQFTMPWHCSTKKKLSNNRSNNSSRTTVGR